MLFFLTVLALGVGLGSSSSRLLRHPEAKKHYSDHNVKYRADYATAQIVSETSGYRHRSLSSVVDDSSTVDENDDGSFNSSSLISDMEHILHYMDVETHIDWPSGNHSAQWDCDTTEHVEHYAKDIYKSLYSHWHSNCFSGKHYPVGQYFVLYVAFVLIVGCVLRYLTSHYHLPVPYTVGLLLLGMIVELLEVYCPQCFGDLTTGFQGLSTVDPHMILVLFIPGLIFESAFNTNYHIFLKEREQAIMLAGPGVVMNTILTGGAMHYFNSYDWDWSFALMFGAIVSATDPVAVVALLRELGASKRLSTLIEAESLLNDGTAFVLFVLLQDYAATSEATVGGVIISFLRLAGGGWLLGILSGMALYKCLSRVFNDFQVEISLTLGGCYIAFYFGDITLGASGVLTVVFMGLYSSKNRQAISPMVEEALHHFWEMVSFIANTILFFVTGQVVMYKVYEGLKHPSGTTSENLEIGREIWVLIVLYIVCHISRGLTIWQLFPILENIGYGCTWKDAIVMTYGGLRGAIGLALALIVENEDAFTAIQKDLVLFHVCGIVLLTLLVNASTISIIVGKLGLNKPSSYTIQLFQSVTEDLKKKTHNQLTQMKLDPHYHGANWTKVELLQPKFESLLTGMFGEDFLVIQQQTQRAKQAYSGDMQAEGHIVDLLQLVQAEEREEAEKQEVEKRVIQVMKSSYWSQYEKGLISADAVYVLVEAADSAMDDHNLSFQIRIMKKYFNIQKYIVWMHRSQYDVLKRLSEWLLFSNLGFAIELSSGFLYASAQADKFSKMLLESGAVDPEHVNAVAMQLSAVTKWITRMSSNVERVYPEVHQAIQTSHAAHALLHHQKRLIEDLKHKGHLDESECSRVMGLCDTALTKLFHTGYGEYLKEGTDENILMSSTLFSELLEEEKEIVLKTCSQKQWFDKEDCIFEAGDKAKQLFVITRGNVDVREVQDKDAIRSRSSTWGAAKSYGSAVTAKGRGDCFDVYTLLQGTRYRHRFVAKTEQVHGFYLNLDLLTQLKDINIDFWDTLWKFAALEVVKYYFQDEDVFAGLEFSGLETLVFNSALRFFDASNDMASQIRVTRGFGLLLNGSVVHISDPSQPVEAPTILTEQTEPYVAVEDCVLMYLDVDRSKAADMIDMPGNSKLAKMLGLGGRTPKVEEESESLTDDHEDDGDTGGGEAGVKAKTPAADGTDEKGDIEDGTDTLQFQSSLPGVDKKPDKLMRLKSAPVGKFEPGTPQDSPQPGGRIHPALISGLSRIRSTSHVKEKGLSMEIDESQIPSRDIVDQWDITDAFEAVKYLIKKHDLWPDVEHFRIHDSRETGHTRHLQAVAEEGSVDASDDKMEDFAQLLAKPGSRAPSPRALQLPKSRFARPSTNFTMSGRFGLSQAKSAHTLPMVGGPMKQPVAEDKPLFYSSKKFAAEKKRVSLIKKRSKKNVIDGSETPLLTDDSDKPISSNIVVNAETGLKTRQFGDDKSGADDAGNTTLGTTTVTLPKHGTVDSLDMGGPASHAYALEWATTVRGDLTQPQPQSAEDGKEADSVSLRTDSDSDDDKSPKPTDDKPTADL